MKILLKLMLKKKNKMSKFHMDSIESEMVKQATIKYHLGHVWWSVIVAFLKQNQKNSCLSIILPKNYQDEKLERALTVHHNYYHIITKLHSQIDKNILQYNIAPFCSLPRLKNLLQKQTVVSVKLLIRTKNIVPYVTRIRKLLNPIQLKAEIKSHNNIELSINRSKCRIYLSSFSGQIDFKSCLTYVTIFEMFLSNQ